MFLWFTLIYGSYGGAEVSVKDTCEFEQYQITKKIQEHIYNVNIVSTSLSQLPRRVIWLSCRANNTQYTCLQNNVFDHNNNDNDTTTMAMIMMSTLCSHAWDVEFSEWNKYLVSQNMFIVLYLVHHKITHFIL